MEIATQRKKTVYLNGRFLTQPITGVQRTAYELVSALDKLLEDGSIDKTAWSFKLIYVGNLVNTIELKHIQIVRKGFLKGNLWEQLELPLYTWGNLLISMCTISSLFKTKQVVVVHDASFLVNPSSFSFLFRTWYKFAIRWLGNVARHIITVSNFSKRELVKHAGFKPDKLSVIYNAPEHVLRFGEPAEEFKIKIEGLKPYCLAVSSLSANKNFTGLSRAISTIDFKQYNMLIAGGVSSTLKATLADGPITYLGYVSNNELKYLYANASLFIFPSFYEGFGIPPLEAMVSGCAVLSSNTSSLPEVLDDACAYCDPANPADMAMQISRLINNDLEIEQLKIKGLAQAQKYSWRKSAVQLFELIRRFA